MTDKPSNHELDDELLSVYLDGELTADERATVEARLATDPAAQQLLHELRSVSQSVQALPTESLGRDLSEDIIRRAREAAPNLDRSTSAKAADASELSRLGETIPKIRVFNSRRAWIWAAMTLAAGLLIMIVQSGDESAKKLPPVAAHNREAADTQLADEAGKPSQREISMSPAPQSASAPPAAIASDNDGHNRGVSLGITTPVAKPSGEGGGGSMSGIARDDIVSGPPVAAASPSPALQREREKGILKAGDASSTFSAAPDQVASDRRAGSPQPTGTISGAVDAPAFAAEKQKSESAASPTPQRIVVVRVVAKPDALKNRSFDRLLADNKIEFVPQPGKSGQFSFGGGKIPQTVKSESVANQPSKDKKTQAVDMVLVEAPAPAIESCLTALNKNSDDFSSIAVSEETQSNDRFDAKKALSKKLAETSRNLSQFNRGNFPVAQKDAIDPRLYFYSYYFDKANEPAVNGSPRAGGFGGDAGAISGVEHDKNGDKAQPPLDVRRARSIETVSINKPQPGEPTSAGGHADRLQSSAQPPNQPMSRRKPNEEAEAKADNQSNNLKVLFVFTSEDTPAPAAPSDSQPK